MTCQASQQLFDEEEVAKIMMELGQSSTQKDEKVETVSPKAVDQIKSPEQREAVEETIVQYPEVPCAFSVLEQALFSVILEKIPKFRSENTFIVRNMQDFRYIMVVLKPHLGPLCTFFRFEFDFEAIANDRSTLQDFIDFEIFINKLGNNF